MEATVPVAIRLELATLRIVYNASSILTCSEGAMVNMSVLTRNDVVAGRAITTYYGYVGVWHEKTVTGRDITAGWIEVLRKIYDSPPTRAGTCTTFHTSYRT